MIKKLGGLKPARVFEYFEQLCAIPHGSGNPEPAVQWLLRFAEENGLEHERDEAGNVILRKGASEGYEHLPTVILQGHTDMVCASDADVQHHFEKDGLQLETDGQIIRAKGTTLGGDDGIAVAMILAILEDDCLKHPPLEAVLTANEEIGLLGAKALDCSRLQGKLLLNLDSEAEGVLTVSCAGGSMTTVKLPFRRRRMNGPIYTVGIDGLVGGHSGAEIHLGRANAALLAGELLQESGAGLVDISGGDADNAIMSSCRMILCGTEIVSCAERMESFFRVQYPNENIRVHVCRTERSDAPVIDLPFGEFLSRAPYGVQAMSKEISGLVQTSLNLGILRTGADALELTYSVRSSVEQEKDALNASLRELAKSYGGDAVTEGSYPAWEYRKDSPLRDRMTAVYRKLYGREMQVEAIHAGLECGLFAGQIEGLDAVSFGPDMMDIHTPRETLSVPSVARTYDYLCAVLRSFGEPV